MGRLSEIDPTHDYGSVTPEVYEYIIERDSGMCVLCGTAGNEVHHIQFKSKLGGNKPNNLILLCFKCHKNQHNLDREKITDLMNRTKNNETKLRQRLV